MLRLRGIPMIPRSVLIILLALGACGPLGKDQQAGVNYSVSAQKNYDKGMDALKEKNWIQAVKYFSFIKSRFPYSKYAVLAELRLADAEYGAEEYLEAIDAYKLFIKFHPTHEMVVNGYASFKIGQAFYEQLPGDFWLMPPSYEKDQSPVEDAEEELRRFVEKYPDSPYRKEADKILAEVGRRLAAHEWYVAHYYWDKDKPMGTVLRLRRLLERYPNVGYDEEALWLLGKAYAKVQMPDRARATWGDLVTRFPASGRASDAKAAIAALPAAAPASPATPQ
ncbi:MAG TPA: outer membrane protein assembly factor BamD [Kofleriaceae bacterium]|jgi:outer membrane protein assembly factor BamD|nr:outer membrane protein assembly factor BamD [Kofleriaceae bacterium]